MKTRIHINDLAWLAGLYEGEGCLSRQGNTKHNYWILAISMTDEDVVRKAHKISGVGICIGPNSPPSLAKYKPTFRWTVSSQGEIHFIASAMLPYLGARRTARINEFLTEHALRVAAGYRPYKKNGRRPKMASPSELPEIVDG